ncbi:protein BCCIP homolog [Anabrus simplex]|uniref:protein BCCIP homolog n=1 Tax=Anabrus simplex TaxID=316456 RepID=UPI0034DDCA21
MAAPVKKRVIDRERNNPVDGDDDSGSDSESSNGIDNIEGLPYQQEIQVDFEGRNPTDIDFHGIKQLLQQLFLKAHVNLSELTNLIISQNYVGSVVKQSENEEDDSEDESDVNDVYGVTSVINLTDKQNLECIAQLRSLLVELCDEHGSDQTITFIRSLLDNDTAPVGLLINERFVNIPAQIAVPLLESLNKEMKRACEKRMPFNFGYFIIICKLYKVDSSLKKNKKKSSKKHQQQAFTDESEILWSNPEEELIDQEAECKFEFSVKAESDSGLSGQWLEDDVEMIPYRRVLVVPATKMELIIERIKTFVAQ